MEVQAIEVTREIHRNREYLSQLIRGQVLIMETMQKHTSWRIGGPADIMVIPEGLDDILAVYRFTRDGEIPLTVLGNGSNLLVRDGGIRGIVLKISRGFNKIEVSGSCVRAEAGALMPTLAARAANAGLTGLEFAAGIPASVGGAVRMNAGAHGRSMSDVVREVTALSPEGGMIRLKGEEVGFEYRKSSIREKGLVVLGASFDLTPGDIAEIKAKTESNLAKRRKSQPLEYPNAGSVFANPPGQWAGWLIEQVGGKGMQVGGAAVSAKHANFIVNLGGATAADVLELVNRIRLLVMEKFNIELIMEIQVVGEQGT